MSLPYSTCHSLGSAILQCHIGSHLIVPLIIQVVLIGSSDLSHVGPSYRDSVPPHGIDSIKYVKTRDDPLLKALLRRDPAEYMNQIANHSLSGLNLSLNLPKAKHVNYFVLQVLRHFWRSSYLYLSSVSRSQTSFDTL